MKHEPFKQHQETFFTVDSWMQKDRQLICGFTTKNGGYSTDGFASLNIGFHVNDDISNVVHNKQLLANQLDFPIDSWIGCEQTHETNIAKIHVNDRGKGSKDYESSLKRTDGLYTSERDCLLTLCYADCVPILFYVPNNQIVGVVHAGWKGTVNGIAKEMIDTLVQKENVSPSDIHVVIGPSICKQCYAVDANVIDAVDKWKSTLKILPYEEKSAGQYLLDLRQLNRQILEHAGVRTDNIQVTSLCTSCDKNSFFSHRRDQGRTGRMMAFIGWKGSDNK